MAGGSGERFWPVSREHRPKQLLKLSSPTASMLDEAVERIEPLVGAKAVFVSTSAHLRSHIEAAGTIPRERILAEPSKRNTLGALVWSVSSLVALGNEPDETSVAILTADHKIGPPGVFRGCVETALDLAESEGGIVTIGIRPDRPETGYGYIEADMESPHGAGFASLGFREKPDLATAEKFLAAGSFLWNSGMFFFTIAEFLSALAETQPHSHAAALEITAALKANDEAGASKAFERLPSLSVDFAVMEAAPRVFVVPSTFDWDDLGAWDALERAMPTDPHGTVSHGETVLIDSPGSIVYNDSHGRIVSVLGMSDVIVVATDDAVLVCPKDQAQRVKEIVRALEDRSP